MAERPQETEMFTQRNKAALEEIENDDRRPAFVLTMTELKLLGIAGVRPFLTFDLVMS